nr:RNA methyltransferase [Pleomorphovibrio marinus]
MDSIEGEAILVGQHELSQIGTFQTNDAALAVATIPKAEDFEIGKGDLVLALDDVRDPGNLGTIIRIADWYGIEKLILSPETADFYNPKVLNASMGSFCRVRFMYKALDTVLGEIKIPVFGAFVDGDNLHKHDLGREGVILVGNESRGISADLAPYIHHKISIPQFGAAESLNVAIATAVICDNFMRKKNQKSFDQ